MNKERLNQIIDNALVVSKEVGKLKVSTNTQSERSKVVELLQDKSMSGIQRFYLEEYLRSLE